MIHWLFEPFIRTSNLHLHAFCVSNLYTKLIDKAIKNGVYFSHLCPKNGLQTSSWMNTNIVSIKPWTPEGAFPGLFLYFLAILINSHPNRKHIKSMVKTFFVIENVIEVIRINPYMTLHSDQA